jgi:DNA ligase-1
VIEGFKPLLAQPYEKVKSQPKDRVASFKLDGIRCTIFDGVPYSRSLKVIPNKYVQKYVKEHAAALEGVDCELIIGDSFAPNVFNVTTSGIMRHDGEPDFTIWAFDKVDAVKSWSNRMEELHDQLYQEGCPTRLKVLYHRVIHDDEELNLFEKEALDLGYEGIMIRDKFGFYKFGRSGTKNPEIQKVKRFVDAEFEVVGFEPKMHNTNEAKINELGHTERSTSKAGMVAEELMGALVLKMNDGSDRTFSCGSGFTDETRKTLWSSRESLIGRKITVKYFEYGTLDGIPRFPVFKGIRAEEDMS